MKILILGITGMLGHKLFVDLSKRNDFEVYGTTRCIGTIQEHWPYELVKRIRENVDADNTDDIAQILSEIQPDVVINCIGIIKQVPSANDHLTTITVNALFPHRLARICKAYAARMIHISTDCVFDGRQGNYIENDAANALDLYGRTKYLGEVAYPHCITLRTSIIGHELKGKYGLIEWFLRQEGRIKGFTGAGYSGFPTIELSRIIGEYVIPNYKLSGLYHVSSDPISKYELLNLAARKYNTEIIIEPSAELQCDRSLNSTRFRQITGYKPPAWSELVDEMYQDFVKNPVYEKEVVREAHND